MNKQIFKLSGVLFISVLFLQSCMHDLRPKTIKLEGITTEKTEKGKQILDRAWKKQGGDKLEQRSVYSFRGKDTWKGMLGKMGKLWSDLKTELDFKYQVGTFEGQVTFLDGKEKGTIAGLQNWNYYEIKNGNTEFLEKDAKSNKRAVFGIAAYQYFSEMLGRIRKAPIVNYGGQKTFNGNQYDLVFCTWEKPEPHMEHDQYVAWINQETGLLDYVDYTIRDTYLKPPGYKMIGGAIEFADYKEIDGVMIPHDHIVYGIKKKKNRKKFLHHMRISNFQFDSFDPEDLRVDKSIAKGGNFKN